MTEQNRNSFTDNTPEPTTNRVTASQCSIKLSSCAVMLVFSLFLTIFKPKHVKIDELFNISLCSTLRDVITTKIEVCCPKCINPIYESGFRYKCCCSITYPNAQAVFNGWAEWGLKEIAQNQTLQDEVKLKTWYHAQLCDLKQSDLDLFYIKYCPFDRVLSSYEWFQMISDLFLKMEWLVPIH